MTPEPIALFDLDGTLADFDSSMRRHMAALAGPGETQSYFVEQEGEPAYITYRRRMVKRQPGFWRDLMPLTLGFGLLAKALDLGFKVNILTKAPRTNFPAWAEKVEWCHKNLPMAEHDIQINLVEDKGLVYGKVLVDDYPPYIERWLKWRPRGLVLMPAQEWNAGYRFGGPNVRRVEQGVLLSEAFKALEEVREECR